MLAVLAAGTLAGAALAAVHMGATPALAAPTTVTFAFTGASQSFTVPAGITSLTVDAFGAQGGHGADQPGGSGGAGGLGGRATATLAVTPGQVLQVNVGGAGGDSSGNIDNGSAGGFGGGGSSTPGGGGGGASDVRSGGFTLGERLLVAGGGGGGAAATSAAGAAGGAGGGISGGAGANGAPSGDGSVAGGGGGGTASAGGSGGSSSVGLFAGQPGAGGAGGTGNSGGGGGWFGGGGGAGSATFGGGDGGGGGGSGFGPTGTVFATGVQAGNGVVTITYAPLPVVTAISPSSGPQTGGTSVTITGAGFAGATAVSFGTTTATSFTVVNDSTITAIAPAANAVGTVDVTVTTSGGTSATSSADQYTYVYPFGGFLAPVASPPTVNMVHAGQAVPLQFQLGGNRGLNVLATRFPQGQRVRCTSGAPINTATETMTAGGSGLQFDPTTNTYTYVWKTPRAASGTCVVFILGLNDGTVHTANFQFA